jgi:hypothetical protein
MVKIIINGIKTCIEHAKTLNNYDNFFKNLELKRQWNIKQKAKQKKISGLLVREITGHPGFFVSRSGIVINPKGKRLAQNWRGTNGGKYLYVTFPGPNGKRLKKQTHILVATEWQFNSDPKNKICVNYLSKNRSNVNSNNLEWSTYAENAKHRDTKKGNRIY